MDNLNYILDGLSHNEIIKLVNDLFAGRRTVSRPNVMGWLKLNKVELYREIVKEEKNA